MGRSQSSGLQVIIVTRCSSLYSISSLSLGPGWGWEVSFLSPSLRGRVERAFTVTFWVPAAGMQLPADLHYPISSFPPARCSINLPHGPGFLRGEMPGLLQAGGSWQRARSRPPWAVSPAEPGKCRALEESSCRPTAPAADKPAQGSRRSASKTRGENHCHQSE